MGDERNVNIHAKPVNAKRIITVEVVTTLYLHGSADYRVEFRDTAGRPVEVPVASEPAHASPPGYTPAEPQIRYEFEGWDGNEDVLTLSESYLNQLEAIVSDGIAKGMVSG
jgi:hypothetical protein